MFYDEDTDTDSGQYITAKSVGNEITLTVSYLLHRFHFSAENNFMFAMALLYCALCLV